MRQPHKHPRTDDDLLGPLDAAESEESDWDSDDDPYSDELLDAFESDETDSYDADTSDADSYDLGVRRGLKDDDFEFDRYFREARSHGRSRFERRRRHRGRDRGWKDMYDFESFERSERGSPYRRRPRR